MKKRAVVSDHAIQRFQERVTFFPYDVAEKFILSDIQHCTFLYSIDGNEKWLSQDGVTYVIKRNNDVRKVLTVYIK